MIAMEKSIFTYEAFKTAIREDEDRAKKNEQKEKELSELGFKHLVSAINKLH